MAELLELEFDRLTPEGAAAAPMPETAGGLAVAWGVLPGERVRVLPMRRQKGALLCRLVEVLRASPDRVAPREDHYLSCSPWQVMRYGVQAEAKRRVLEQLFPSVALERFVATETVWGYRNKMEFSFTECQGRLQLAFHERGHSQRRLPLPEGCLLAGPAMNAAALEVVAWLAARGIRSSAVKSLIVRGSRATGQVVVGLYVMDENFSSGELKLERSVGWTVYYSDPLSPASVETRLLERQGEDHLVERVAGVDLAWPLEGFFQNHAEVFSLAVEEIRRHIPETRRIAELYSGVGAIGLALRDKAEEILAVESNEAASAWAERNRCAAGAENYHPLTARAELCAEEILLPTDVVVVDPPRTGLHPRLVGALVRTKPSRIVYLSCNPANQARDAAMLGTVYRAVTLVGFDFYPQTPHLESLLVLDRAADVE
jgi:23S rRNA (uracil1939-C5)-methyltransferase